MTHYYLNKRDVAVLADRELNPKDLLYLLGEVYQHIYIPSGEEVKLICGGYLRVRGKVLDPDKCLSREIDFYEFASDEGYCTTRDGNEHELHDVLVDTCLEDDYDEEEYDEIAKFQEGLNYRIMNVKVNDNGNLDIYMYAIKTYDHFPVVFRDIKPPATEIKKIVANNHAFILLLNDGRIIHQRLSCAIRDGKFFSNSLPIRVGYRGLEDISSIGIIPAPGGKDGEGYMTILHEGMCYVYKIADDDIYSITNMPGIIDMSHRMDV